MLNNMKKSKFALPTVMFLLMGMTLMTSCKKNEPISKFCDLGYEGENCDKLIRNHVTGNYIAKDIRTSDGSSSNYNLEIAPNLSFSAVSIINFGDFFMGAQIVVANVTRTGDAVNFIISSQMPNGMQSVTISGSGSYSISNRKISIDYLLVNNGGTSSSYTGVWTKL